MSAAMDRSDGMAASPDLDLGRPQSQARLWFEPLLIVLIMFASLYFNRDSSFSVFHSRNRHDDTASLIKSNGDYFEDSRTSSRSTSPDPPTQKDSLDVPRSISPLPWTEYPTKMNFPSRILQKFPFLVEMFYWALNYVAYAMTKKAGGALYSRYGGDQVTQLAQENGINILTLEHDTPLRLFFPVTEVAFQQFFLKGHLGVLSFFNQIYSLVHIPGTVAFLSWWYFRAPSHDVFALVRRTMTLGNFSSFFIFSLYPCMPPRLLPESFGFRDTVRQDHAESVWAGGNNVNQLAAMPSLHFTYAFIIGCTFLYQSGALQACRGSRGVTRKNPVMSFGYIVAGVVYPLLVLSVIVATANHYWLDAVVATFSVALSLLCNRVWLALIPLERLFCRILRLRKPTPTTARSRSREEPPRPRIVIDLA